LKSVPARHGPCQHAILVDQGNGDPVQLQFGDVGGDLPFQPLAYARIELPQFRIAVGVVDGQHGNAMGRCFEVAEGHSAHAKGGRIGLLETRVGGLNGLKLAHERVEGLIGNFRGGLRIIKVGMALNIGFQRPIVSNNFKIGLGDGLVHGGII
jgi:hypothetical protein